MCRKHSRRPGEGCGHVLVGQEFTLSQAGPGLQQHWASQETPASSSPQRGKVLLGPEEGVLGAFFPWPWGSALAGSSQL